ncbi:hypothetical protein CAEBREN_04349 [Caenorhabditis brenneri]|uniref:Uncharacterized protein n=1 Tax=Caenorhabditis brenneri TaxID=135651 RepID=G0NBJ9_CAEBE|nr:hypothetical protein CAEBREN_04349 [Caenorhabditis brenneri]
MANRGPNGRPPGNEGNGNMNLFERNKYRQTMPSRFNPISPPDQRNGPSQRFHSNSPTQSHVSTATTYEQPWSSPQFRPPAPPDEPRFRRTHSMAAKKPDKKEGSGEQPNTAEGQKNERPKINFKEFGKKFTNKFKKNNAKNETKKGGDRMSAPVLSIGQSAAAASTSQPQLPSTKATSSSPVLKKPKASASLKMQPEDRMKMFQKMGRQQSMKETSIQRMQRERQRDFSLVPGPGRSCLEANLGSNQSIDSILVFNTTPDSRRSTSLSMTDDDVEPIFKNSLTQKSMTSSQYNNQQKLTNGPSFTSTPRLAGSFHAESPTISNVRSASEASFCIVSSENSRVNRTESTMYYSSGTLNTPVGLPVPRVMIQGHSTIPQNPVRSLTDVSFASTASTPTGTSSKTATSSGDPPSKRVKEEVVDPVDDQTPSDCPSFNSTSPTSDLEGLHVAINSQPEHLSNLWMVSKEIRDKQLQLQHHIPLMETMKNRAMAIDQQKMLLYESKGDNPSAEDMRTVWNLDREFIKLNQDMVMTQMAIHDAHNMIPYLEMRRNELLAVSPPPQNVQIPTSTNLQPGSFV